jgi:hypothetical protein
VNTDSWLDALRSDALVFIGFKGLEKAKIEAQRAIVLLEPQLKFREQNQCLSKNKMNTASTTQLPNDCSFALDRDVFLPMVEAELKYLQSLSTREKSIEVDQDDDRLARLI